MFIIIIPKGKKCGRTRKNYSFFPVSQRSSQSALITFHNADTTTGRSLYSDEPAEAQQRGTKTASSRALLLYGIFYFNNLWWSWLVMFRCALLQYSGIGIGSEVGIRKCHGPNQWLELPCTRHSDNKEQRTKRVYFPFLWTLSLHC